MTILPPPSRMFAEGHIITALIRADMVLAVETTHPTDWSEMIGLAVVNHGGSLTLPADPAHPRRGDSWESHMAELSLLGITGRGDDLEAAVRDWAKAAERTLEIGRAA